MSARTKAGLFPVVLAALLLVGTSCASDDHTTEVLPVPRVGQCHDPAPGALRSDKVDDSPPVACTQPHTLETVGVVGSAARPSTASYRVLNHRCRVAAKHYLGMGAEENSTLAFPFIYLPDAEQRAAGQDWVRCDVGVQAETECCSALVTETRSVRDAVARDPVDYDECIDHLPDLSRSLPLVSCREPHRAELLGPELRLHTGIYPLPGPLEHEGQARCAALVAGRPDRTRLTLTPVWQPAEAFRGGTLFGACWINRRSGRLPPR